MAETTFESLLCNAKFVDTKKSFVQFKSCEDIGLPEEDIARFKTFAISDGQLEIRIRAAELKGQLFIKYIQASPRDGKADPRAGIKVEGKPF